MANRTRNFTKFSIVRGDIKVDADLTRLGKRFQDAQFALDTAVMNSMVPFMPMQTGLFIAQTRAISASLAGTGIVCAAAPPMGRFLYEGKGMVDEVTGSPWARKGARKVLVSQYGGKTWAKENLDFSKNANPKATPHWFEAAKAQDVRKWGRIVKATVGR